MAINTVELLRENLKEQGIGGFLVPRGDAWPGEFVSSRAERLAWLSGFSGSAGVGVVLVDKAVILTDGRYTLQVADQIDARYWSSDDITKVSVPDWLVQEARAGAKIGYDPILHTKAHIEAWEQTLDKKGISLIPLDVNPIDALWTNQPAMPDDPVFLFPDHIAGKTSAEKMEELSGELREKDLAHYFFAMPDSIAWLLNVRGNDVLHTPVPLSYGILNEDGAFDWFIDPQKVPDVVQDHLGTSVRVHPIDTVERHLTGLNAVVGIDEQRSPYKFSQILGDAAEHVEDPCILLKACKNELEQAAIRTAHIHDGRALVAFHKWLKDPKFKKKDELNVEAYLEDLRRKEEGFKSPSFSTIAGYESNGAIMHYRATKKTSKKITGSGGVLLVDSGGQYMSDTYAGTTDVTRTYIMGEATPTQMHHYTRVLKAHIAVARATFPYGTTGSQIDALARSVLWEEGLDFAHGLGHGVGCFLNVHEDAAPLSPRLAQRLEPGMLLSNEPGLYLEGQYGIRIENLMLVQKTGEKDILGRDMLHFETVTLAPYDNELIIFSDLSGAEMQWLEDYYRLIEEKLGD